GNQAARGHGRGRPPKPFTELLNETSVWSIRQLRRIASDRDHAHQFDAMVTLAKICTPRRKEAPPVETNPATMLLPQLLGLVPSDLPPPTREPVEFDAEFLSQLDEPGEDDDEKRRK